MLTINEISNVYSEVFCTHCFRSIRGYRLIYTSECVTHVLVPLMCTHYPISLILIAKK